MIDICGEKLAPGTKTIKSSGFIESLSYPKAYSPLTNCTCAIETPDAFSHFTLYMLDMELAPESVPTDGSTNGTVPRWNDCTRDWLEYNIDVPAVGRGHKLCGQTKDEPLFITAKRIFLNFVSDDELETRGFWLKYTGS